jgi:hypothetical protein
MDWEAAAESVSDTLPFDMMSIPYQMSVPGC